MGLLAVKLFGIPANAPCALAFQLKLALALERTPAVCLLNGGTALCIFSSAADHAKATRTTVDLFGVPVTVCDTAAPRALPKLLACDGRRVRVQIVSDTM
jgi:hypothetical protein